MVRYWLAITGLIMCCTGTASADRHQEIAELKQQVQQILGRIEQLERQAAPAPDKESAPAKAQWTDTLKLSGDLRYRHESIDQDGSDERIRHRVRARVQLKASPTENTEVVVRLASGSDDPVSTNQSLDGGFSTKDFGLDLAYFKTELGQGNAVIAGKMKNPLFAPGNSSLLWDGDLTPEGLAWTYENGSFFANAIGFVVEERSSASDSLVLGGQLGLSRTISDGVDVVAGVGFYDYAATMGRSPFFDANGNSTDADGNYLFDYELTEVFAQMTAALADMPLVVYLDWVNNSAGGGEDTGFAVGAKLGKASKPGQWDFGYTYKDLEADAVLATFTDSDIGGGGTAIRGHVLSLGHAFSKRLGGKLTYFISENRTDTLNPRDYNRLQADISVKY